MLPSGSRPSSSSISKRASSLRFGYMRVRQQGEAGAAFREGWSKSPPPNPSCSWARTLCPPLSVVTNGRGWRNPCSAGLSLLVFPGQHLAPWEEGGPGLRWNSQAFPVAQVTLNSSQPEAHPAKYVPSYSLLTLNPLPSPCLPPHSRLV